MVSCLFSSPALAREFLYDLCVKTEGVLERFNRQINPNTVITALKLGNPSTKIFQVGEYINWIDGIVNATPAGLFQTAFDFMVGIVSLFALLITTFGSLI